MLKRVIVISVLALASAGIGGAAEAHDNGDPDCIEAGVFVGGVTHAEATCQMTFSNGYHEHCLAFVGPALVAVARDCQ